MEDKALVSWQMLIHEIREGKLIPRHFLTYEHTLICVLCASLSTHVWPTFFSSSWLAVLRGSRNRTIKLREAEYLKKRIVSPLSPFGIICRHLGRSRVMRR